MSCAITSGRTEPCRDAIGGLKAAYVMSFIEDAFTIAAGEATAIDSGITDVYKYELLNDGNTFVETSTSDANTGVTTYEKVLTAVLKKQDKETQLELSLLRKARTICVVQYRSGAYRVFGYEDGCVGGGDNQSGGAKPDFNGYNLTLTATEQDPSPYLDSTTVTALLALVSSNNINP